MPTKEKVDTVPSSNPKTQSTPDQPIKDDVVELNVATDKAEGEKHETKEEPTNRVIREVPKRRLVD